MPKQLPIDERSLAAAELLGLNPEQIVGGSLTFESHEGGRVLVRWDGILYVEDRDLVQKLIVLLFGDREEAKA